MTTATKKTGRTSQGSSVKFVANQTFDSDRMRHYLNGKVSVLHCHHSATLFTQLATDAEDMNGPALLTEASSETFYPVLRDYYRENTVSEIDDRIAIAEQYCAFIGLGEIELGFSDNTGYASMKHSHVDEGWVQKWGQRDSRVNFIGEGFIRAAWAAIFDKSPSECKVEETQSIVSGSSTSKFALNW